MKKVLSMLCLAACVSTAAFAQETAPAASQEGGMNAKFMFLPDNDMFYRLQGDNDAELQRLHSFVEQNKAAIREGDTPVKVNGYCAGDLASAKVRSNRVKSELILAQGLLEEDFLTSNKSTEFEGHKSVVVVTIDLTGEATAEQSQGNAANQEELDALKCEQQELAERVEAVEDDVVALEERVENLENTPVVSEAMVAEMIAANDAAKAAAMQEENEWNDSYCFALRTNLLYWAGLLPNIGVEWRANSWLGIKVDGAFSSWNLDEERSHKMWMVSPEIRFYMGEQNRLYLGLGGNIGAADMSWKPVSRILHSADSGADGKFYGGGLVLGYQARLTNRLSLDLNLGLGVTHYEYDTYQIVNAARVAASTDHTQNVWGLTQAGVTLSWSFGGNQ
jgi:hypothetical protein